MIEHLPNIQLRLYGKKEKIDSIPFQCASLAQACHLACEHSLRSERDHWRSLGQLFQAYLVAGLGQEQMSSAAAAAVIEQVQKLNAEGCVGSVNGHRWFQNDFES